MAMKMEAIIAKTPKLLTTMDMASPRKTTTGEGKLMASTVDSKMTKAFDLFGGNALIWVGKKNALFFNTGTHIRLANNQSCVHPSDRLSHVLFVNRLAFLRANFWKMGFSGGKSSICFFR